MLGANKFDLMLDYETPQPPAGADPDGYRRVRVAMAKKAILDARDAGLTFFRVAVTGYGPASYGGASDLRLWQSDPPRFWAQLDEMFDDLDAAGIQLVPSFVWNVAQFPALAHEDTGALIRDTNSGSRQLLVRFVREFMSRYKARKTILFYELANELNLLADLDEQKRNCKADPCLWRNFATADMVAFGRQMVAEIKLLDPSRGVSSGYSLPRGNAGHLERRPEYSLRGADWAPDTAEEFARELLAVNEPFDIVSVHIYPPDETRPSGKAPGPRFDPIAESAKAVHAAGKKLFVGEFGDEKGATPFMKHTLDDIVSERVDYAAVWVWELYQTSTHETHNTPATLASVEPSYSETLVGELMRTEQRLGAPASRAEHEPIVVLTWPLPCAKIDRPVDLAAVASDRAGSPKQVEFLVAGQPLATATAPPYKARFDPTGRSPGVTEIEVRALGKSGNIGIFRAPIRVNGAPVGCIPSAG